MFPDLLRARLPAAAPLSEELVAQLVRHCELMLKWNRTLNLTRIDRLDEVVERHYCESVFLARHLPPSGRIVDIGSGAGFPGIPVAVLCPGSAVTLVESHQRKAVFLKEAARQLPNVRVLACRAEAVRERFDWAISRAVSYEDLRGPLKALAANAALLTGLDEPPASLGFSWEEPILLPWGTARFLRIGRQEFPPGQRVPGLSR